MPPAQTETAFHLWGADRVVYGPVHFSRIVEWFGTGLAKPETWVYSETDGAWRPVKERPEFQELIQSSRFPEAGADQHDTCIFDLLREIDLFRGLTKEQVESFSKY